MSEAKIHTAPLEGGAEVLTLTVPRRIAEPMILALLLLLGLGFFIGSLGIESSGEDAVGAQTFPKALSVIFMAIVLARMFAALRLPPEDTLTLKRPRGLIVAMALLITFPALVQMLGYYVLILPWLLIFGWAARVRSPFLIVINLVTVLFVAKVIFQMTLGTPLP